MRANISIDVSLLAIILSMYFTKQENNMILILIAILVTHVLITSDNDGYNDDSEQVQNQEVHLGTTNGNVEKMETPVEQVVKPTSTKEKPFSPNDHFKTTVSSGVFNRNISTPQTQLTSSVFPRTSQDANGKLADSRGSFFESLVS